MLLHAADRDQSNSQTWTDKSAVSHLGVIICNCFCARTNLFCSYKKYRWRTNTILGYLNHQHTSIFRVVRQTCFFTTNSHCTRSQAVAITGALFWTAQQSVLYTRSLSISIILQVRGEYLNCADRKAKWTTIFGHGLVPVCEFFVIKFSICGLELLAQMIESRWDVAKDVGWGLVQTSNLLVSSTRALGIMKGNSNEPRVMPCVNWSLRWWRFVRATRDNTYLD